MAAVIRSADSMHPQDDEDDHSRKDLEFWRRRRENA